MSADIAALVSESLEVWTGAVERKSSAGRGGGGKAALYGVDRLRALILELAVRGKLVTQNASDEPATILVDAIEREKSRLIKQKKVKKGKPLRSPQEWPFDLPPSWEWTLLGDVTNYGQTDKADPGSTPENLWVLELEDVEKSSSKLLARVRCADRPFRSQKNWFEPGDVIYGKLRPYLDKVIVADEAGVCTTEMIPLRGYLGIVPEYLRIFLKSPFFIRLASEASYGMNLPRLGTEDARAAPFALPPLSEQKRIVAKVDELMALCDELEAQSLDALEAHQTLVKTVLTTLVDSADATELAANWARLESHFNTLFTTSESIDFLRRIVIDLAVRGKLTSRAEAKMSGTERLKCIADAKQEMILQRKIRKDRPTTPVDATDFPFEVPDSWTWCRIGAIALSTEYGTSRKATQDGEGVTVLAMGNIQDGLVNLDSNKAIPSSSEEIPDLLLTKGDVLYNRTNSYELVGKTGIFRSEETNYTFASYLIRIRVDGVNVSPEFLNLCMNAPYFRQTQVVPKITKQTGQANVSGGSMRNMLVPLPPIEEQVQIVDKADQLLSLCARLSAKIIETDITRVALADSIVERLAA